MGQLLQDSWDRTAGTGKFGYDREDRRVRTGNKDRQLEKDSTAQPGGDSQERTVRTRLSGADPRTRQPGQYRPNRTIARTART
jgi:hypothetical protein